MYCNTKKSGSMMGMGMAIMMRMMMRSCATRQMMDKSSKMRKFGMKKNEKTGGTRGIVPANMR